MRRWIFCWMAVLMLLPCVALAAGTPVWQMVPDTLHPGEEQTLYYSVPQGQEAVIRVTDIAGTELAELGTVSGSGCVVWDGEGLSPGSYLLLLDCGMLSAEEDLTIGEPVPAVKILSADETAAPQWTCSMHFSMAGTLTATLQDGSIAFGRQAQQGDMTITWDASTIPTGSHTLTLTLYAGEQASTPVSLSLKVRRALGAHDEVSQTPGDMTGVTCEHEICYWKLPMGELDDQAVWAVLTQPITVVEASERHQVKIRREPRQSCTDYTGEVTGQSQAVHVLQRGDEWSLIQAYSSSVQGSRVAVFAKPFTGYIRTELLKERTVSQHTGIVIDKLQQRLYVYKDGKLLTTMLCSTGYSKKDTPFNETPAGEFVCQSWTGGFWSGSLWCDYGIRINDGILLHEVPVLVTQAEDGSEIRNEQRCEQYLGDKASHGCIRIQRKLTPESVNMKWLWDHLNRGSSNATKVIIWDEVGRTLAYPEDSYTLYYNPKGGTYYHSSATCEGVRSNYLPLTPFQYGQLSEKPYKKLTPCPYCAPQPTHDGVDTLNKKNTRVY